MSPTKIFLIDDHALFRSGLRMVLASGMENIEVLEAGSLEEAMRSETVAPAILLLDLHLQGLNGLESIALLKRKWPLVAIVVLSSDCAPETVRLALERGAVRFISKGDTAANMLAIIGEVLHGQPAGDGMCAGAGRDGGSRPGLTPRQCEVLNLLFRGLSNKLIARQLNISENTVRVHVQAVLAELQVVNRSEAIFEARRRGLVG